jgi:hypothetical protein
MHRGWIGLAFGLALCSCDTFGEPPSRDPVPDIDGRRPPQLPPPPIAGPPSLVPPSPQKFLRVRSRMPDAGARDVDPATEIVVELSEPIAPLTGGRPVAVGGPNGELIAVELALDPTGTVLRVKPRDTLEQGTTYTVSLDPGLMARTPTAIFLSAPSEREWSFTTREDREHIELPLPLARVAYDANTHRLFGFDVKERTLVAFDLAQRTIANMRPLDFAPDDLCVSPDGQRVFVVAQLGQSVTELDATTLEPVRAIAWGPTNTTQMPGGAVPVHFHVRCTAERLFLIDGARSPGLWVLPHGGEMPVDHSMQLAGVGDLVTSADGDALYYWEQVGWGEGNAGTNVVRFDLPNLVRRDRSEIDHSAFPRDPLDAPILLDEAHGRVLTKNHALDRNDLSTVVFRLGDGEVVYAADFARNRVATKTQVYAADTFAPIAPTLSRFGQAQFFDRDGVLYFVDNRRPSLIVQRF